MSSIPGSDNLSWSDEQTRFYLQLRIEEKLKGNIRNQAVNDTARLSIIDKFNEVYGERHPWKKFGIKYTTCKKQYESFKRLTRKTGLGFHPNGSIDMSDDWWNEQCKEWPGARKVRDKPLANMDLMEQVFGTVHISGAEGWSAQQGERRLDIMSLQDTEDLNDAESRQIPPTQGNDDVDANDEIHGRSFSCLTSNWS